MIHSDQSLGQAALCPQEVNISTTGSFKAFFLNRKTTEISVKLN